MKVFNLLIIDDLTPWHCPEVSVKAFSNRECAESKMLEMFVSKRQELENEGYHVFKTDTFAPCCDDSRARLLPSSASARMRILFTVVSAVSEDEKNADSIRRIISMIN